MRFCRLICVGLIATAGLGRAAAQSVASPQRRFGITAGVNSSMVASSHLGDASRRTGFTAGALLVFPVAPAFAIEPELLYTTKGYEVSGPDFSSTLKMSYVEIPVLLRVEVPASGGVKPLLYGGPAVSFKATCDVDSKFQGISMSTSCDPVQSDFAKIKTLDYGLVVGGGLEFDVAGKMITIGARYDHSFRTIAENSDVKHRVISVLATLEFPWGNR